jgi:hypothetical protein
MIECAVMKLKSRFGKCIWCTNALRPRTPDAPDAATDEHIFPARIFGAVSTPDCCKDCNNRLGDTVDIKILADERIVLAAREAGIKEHDLLSQYSGSGLDSQQRPARYTVKHGRFRLNPTFQDQGFRIGLINGTTFTPDLQNAKAKMTRLAEEDASLQLTREQISTCVNDLFEAFLAKGGKETVYCPKLKQRLQSGAGPTHITLEGDYRPYETQWAIAKILYETGIMLLPPEIFAKVGSAFDQLRRFVQTQTPGVSILSYESARSNADRCHSAEIHVCGTSLHCSVTLFGKLTWATVFTVTEQGQPANLEKFELAIRNDFPFGASKFAAVLINGQNYRPDQLC